MNAPFRSVLFAFEVRVRSLKRAGVKESFYRDEREFGGKVDHGGGRACRERQRCEKLKV